MRFRRPRGTPSRHRLYQRGRLATCVGGLVQDGSVTRGGRMMATHFVSIRSIPPGELETALITLPDARTQNQRAHFRIVALPGGMNAKVSFVAVELKGAVPLWVWKATTAMLL